MTNPTTIYNFNEQTGELLGESPARYCPKSGRLMLPAHATEIAPPKAKPCHAVVFADGKWVQLEDNRGQTYWLPGDRFNMHTLSQLGEKKPAEALSEPPPPSDEELATQARFRQQQLLVKADHMVNRCQDQGDEKGEAECRAYRQLLRDVPQQPGFPTDFEWPPVPQAGASLSIEPSAAVEAVDLSVN